MSRWAEPRFEMFSRRTRALLDLIAGLFAFGVLVAGRREANRERSGATGPEGGCNRDSSGSFRRGLAEATPAGPVSRPWFIVGMATAIGYRYLYDRDVRSLRRSRSRRALAGVVLSLSDYAIGFLGDETDSYSVGLGRAVGVVCYRMRYGLLGAPPE